MNYKIIVEEVINKGVWVEANSAEEAMDKVEQMYKSGEFVLDGDAMVNYKQMCVELPEEEQTEWTTF